MADLHEYKCPNCGGGMEFNTHIQKLKCPFCDSEYELDQFAAPEEPAPAQSQPTFQEADGMVIYTCQSCGGEIITDGKTSASTCPYCDNPIVMTGNVSGSLKPDLIIPFKLDKKAATEALKKHLSGKKLLPAVFKDQNHIDEIKGVYVPFWLFDAESDANITYHATKVRRWSDSNFDYKETSHYEIHRAGTLGFDNVPVKGTTKMEAELMESIEPFDLTQAVDFNTAYLAGYLADKYDVTPEESEGRISERVKRSTDSTFSGTVKGFDTVNKDHGNVNIHPGTPKYALYPVWILNTTWNGKKYVFAMNGQTGKFVGDLPMDQAAYRKNFLTVGAIAAAVTYIVGLLIHLL